jgi:hypothetical protein
VISHSEEKYLAVDALVQEDCLCYPQRLMRIMYWKTHGKLGPNGYTTLAPEGRRTSCRALGCQEQELGLGFVLGLRLTCLAGDGRINRSRSRRMSANSN